MSRTAITFPAWKHGPIVAAQQTGTTIAPLAYGFRGDVYSVTGTVLAKASKIEDFTSALGYTPQRAPAKEIHGLRGLVNAQEIRRLLGIEMGPTSEETPSAVEAVADTAKAEAEAKSAAVKAEAEAKSAAEARFRKFLAGHKFTTLTGRDPRCPPEALRHARETKARVLFVVEVKDRRQQTALVIGAFPGVFFPAVPEREAGKSAAARNRWAADVLTSQFEASLAPVV